ncbi:hypothetical protein NW768_000901 [Fusarium equiseti]|uniref:RING-type domain-containing protein n=1 Tax=Fusarium equiseti TaxID=61235 RepID=A0ABQ8RU12_FUSEQ|nr:hypothetical protein NW768_000901 [Fusarium equiseti]
MDSTTDPLASDPLISDPLTSDSVTSDPDNTEPITSTNWPTLVKEVEEDPDNKRDLRLTCDICFELMATSPGQNLSNLCHEAFILPCGHMFGQSCIEEWMKSAQRRRYVYSCPACRAKMKRHSKCGHPIRGRCIPPSRDEYSNVSPLMSEGSKQLSRCTRCLTTGAIEVLKDFIGDLGVELEPGQTANFRLVSPDASQQFILPYTKGKEYHVDRNLDLPEQVRRGWTRVQNRLIAEGERFWFEMDIGRWELVVSVMDVLDEGEPNETVVQADAAPGTKLFNIYGRE